MIEQSARYRRLAVPGEEELIGVNIHFCATCDGAFYKGKEVLVIGGGNSGFEEGLFLTKFAHLPQPNNVRCSENSAYLKLQRWLSIEVGRHAYVGQVQLADISLNPGRP